MGRYGNASYGAPEWDGTSPKTWDEWTDVLGQTYRPGDYVAIAVVNGKSPQMVIGKVIQINRVDSKGQMCVQSESHWEDCTEDTPGARRKRGRLSDGTYGDLNAWHINITEYIDSCTVKVQPLLDARSFGRGYWNQDKAPKAVTYRLHENIIKVDGAKYEAKVAAEMAAMADDLKEILGD